MSRALDPGIKQALRDGKQADVFEEIAAILSPTSAPVEIELLGHSHYADPVPSFLRDGNAIAIPKLRLAQAFLHARASFAAHTRGGAAGQAPEPGSVRKATAVMLLFDPEHLTAANARKRLVVADDDARPRPAEAAAAALMREKLFVDSLLTSRLHRHSKSPNLWSHRRWLLERLRERGRAVDAGEELRTVVFVSAERHGRNYHAWGHARYMVRSAARRGADADADAAAAATMLAQTERWCRGHHDDVSGWMFLAFLLERWPAEAAAVVARVAELAASLRWRNESVWYFLRSVVPGTRLAAPQRERFRAAWRAVRDGCGEDDGAGRRVLDGASSWIEAYSHSESAR